MAMQSSTSAYTIGLARCGIKNSQKIALFTLLFSMFFGAITAAETAKENEDDGWSGIWDALNSLNDKWNSVWEALKDLPSKIADKIWTALKDKIFDEFGINKSDNYAIDPNSLFGALYYTLTFTPNVSNMKAHWERSVTILNSLYVIMLMVIGIALSTGEDKERVKIWLNSVITGLIWTNLSWEIFQWVLQLNSAMSAYLAASLRFDNFITAITAGFILSILAIFVIAGLVVVLIFRVLLIYFGAVLLPFAIFLYNPFTKDIGSGMLRLIIGNVFIGFLEVLFLSMSFEFFTDFTRSIQSYILNILFGIGCMALMLIFPLVVYYKLFFSFTIDSVTKAYVYTKVILGNGGRR